jgi:hypothetical protein
LLNSLFNYLQRKGYFSTCQTRFIQFRVAGILYICHQIKSKMVMTKFLRNSFALLVISLFTLTVSCSKDDDDNDPVASFTWELTSNPGEVVFNNTSTNADIYNWSFGNGKSSTVVSPTHVYEQNDSFIVTLTATGKGMTVSVKDTVLVDNMP